MALSIIVPEEVIDEPVMIELAESFQRRSSSNKEHSLGTVYQFSNLGENKFTAEAYLACDAYGCLMDGGLFYHVFTEAEINEPSPIDWPRSKEEAGKDILIKDYFQQHTQYLLDDGTWLFRITRENVGLTDADRKTYQASLGTLLVKSEGLGKLPVVEGV